MGRPELVRGVASAIIWDRTQSNDLKPSLGEDDLKHPPKHANKCLEGTYSFVWMCLKKRGPHKDNDIYFWVWTQRHFSSNRFCGTNDFGCNYSEIFIKNLLCKSIPHSTALFCPETKISSTDFSSSKGPTSWKKNAWLTLWSRWWSRSWTSSWSKWWR